MNAKVISTTLSLATLGAVLLTGAAIASPGEYERDEHYERRGPMPFEVLDLNRDGTVSAEEHARVRSERHAERAEHGYRLRNAGNAPSFEQIDRDSNGSIDREELSQWQAQRMQERQAGRSGGRGW